MPPVQCILSNVESKQYTTCISKHIAAMMFGDGYDVWRWLCCLEMVMMFGNGYAVWR